MNRISLIAGLAALVLSAQAAEVYRWVDENGRTQFSDSVPDRYKGVATKVDIDSRELSDAQRREAAARAAREKSAADRALKSSGKAPSPGATQPPAVGAAADAGKAAECEALFKRYRESQECFMPYRMANGALRAEAYQRCKEVPDPSSRCGPTPNY